MNADAEAMIDMAYDALEGCDDLAKYKARHGTPSLLILTQHDPEIARQSAELLRPHIEGKSVIEIGAGVGFLALEMARIAKSVIAIEADPAWSWIFTHSLYKHKPANLSWIFGSAEWFVGTLHADVAVIFTNSGIERMFALGTAMAHKVVMPLQDVQFTSRKFECDPEGKILEHKEAIAAMFQ